MRFPITDEEQKLEELFVELSSGFKELDKLKNVQRQETLLRDLTEKIKDGKASGCVVLSSGFADLCCRLVKEFEREARSDGMPAAELAERRRMLVNQLNNFISIKKTQTQILSARAGLLAGSQERQQEGVAAA